MVSETIICGTLISLCATLNNVPTEEVVAQISYETLSSKEHLVAMVEDTINPYLPRDILSKEVMELFQGYIEYEKEQERLAEIERQRLIEEQEREEEERRKALENMYPYKNYRQTYYSVQEGEISLGSLYYYGHDKVKAIDNVMHFNDSEYGWIPIVAININEVYASGVNENGTPNLYGSVIEMKYNNDTTTKAIVLDACGECSRSSKIDLWVYRNDQTLDTQGVDFRYLRKGW